MTAAALGLHMEVEPQSAQDVAELAECCANMWAQSLGQYYKDARAVWIGSKQPNDYGEALDDLMGSRELLGNLLAGYGGEICPQRLGDLMLDAIEQGMSFKPAGMTRPVPERAEDYTAVNAWRAKHKRQGKPEALTLG